MKTFKEFITESTSLNDVLKLVQDEFGEMGEKAYVNDFVIVIPVSSKEEYNIYFEKGKWWTEGGSTKKESYSNAQAAVVSLGREIGVDREVEPYSTRRK